LIEFLPRDPGKNIAFTKRFDYGPVHFRSEEVGQSTGWTKQGISHACFEIRIDPSVYWDPKSHFGFFGDFGREPALGNCPQNSLAIPAIDL